ncbi:MAG: hypothetical protein MJ150_02450 [Clostridia bacterium]|nr:hypothetical protein [Clostridia bacterium]
MERKKTFDIIISFLIAIVLWFYVINIVNPQKDQVIRMVPVNVSGVEALEDRGFAIAGDLKYTVNLSVIGARNDLAKLTAADFEATADVASLNKGNTYITVKVAGPRGIVIEDINTELIPVLVEDYVTESKPVRIAFSDEADGHEITITKFTDSVNVSGAKSDVDKVVHVLTQLSANSLHDDVNSTVNLLGRPCDKSGMEVGGIKLAVETIEMDATLSTKKTVSLSSQMFGEPLYGELSIENFEVQSVISIKGPANVINGISTIVADPINIEGIDKTTHYQLVPQLPAGVHTTRDCPELTAVVYIAENAKELYEQSLASEGAIELPEEQAN